MHYDTVVYQSADDLSLVYRDYRSEETRDPSVLSVLCIPGMTRNARDFQHFADSVASNYRVLCPDLRGRGASDYAGNPETYTAPVYIDDLLHLLEHAGVTRTVVIGTSFGGGIALRFAAAHRDAVAGLVLNDVAPGSPGAKPDAIRTFLRERVTVNGWREAESICKARYGASYPDWTAENWHTMARALFRKGSESHPEILVPDYDPGLAVPFETGQAIDNSDLWTIFTTCRDIPVLIVRGELSQNLSPGQCERMLKVNPKSSVITIPNVGHAPTLTEPAAHNSVMRFLKSLS